jgi:3'-phosphoadenosine 5'-phosphosulfate sulfotransferase (PAPS reductase)/FAD synthetase
MQNALRIIEESLATAKSPVVLSSFQKDSLLLTWLVRQVKDVPILWFRDKRNKFAEKIIQEWNLTVFGYAPADRYLIPDQDGMTLVDEYSVGSSRLPVLRDVVKDSQCDLEHLSDHRTPLFNYPFDLTFWGFKKSDVKDHYVTNHTVFPQEFNLGHTRVLAPLMDWNDEDVMKAIKELDIPFEAQDDSVGICESCSNALNDWDSEASLFTFRERFSFH